MIRVYANNTKLFISNNVLIRLLPDHKKREIKFLYDKQKLTGEEIAKQTGVSRSTIYRILNKKQATPR